MDVRQLRYLVAVADELSFTKAALRSNVSQPSLSRAINQLETEVGAQLFDRDTHRVTLTAAGASLAEDARRSLDLMQDSLARARQIAGGLRGTLSLGFGGSPVYSLWPAMIKRFRSVAPDVGLRFVTMPVLSQIEALREFQIDLGIVRLPVHDELLRTALIHREPLVVAVPSDPAAPAVKAAIRSK